MEIHRLQRTFGVFLLFSQMYLSGRTATAEKLIANTQEVIGQSSEERASNAVEINDEVDETRFLFQGVLTEGGEEKTKEEKEKEKEIRKKRKEIAGMSKQVRRIQRKQERNKDRNSKEGIRERLNNFFYNQNRDMKNAIRSSVRGRIAHKRYRPK